MRQYERVDYEAALDQTITIREVLPADHLARSVTLTHFRRTFLGEIAEVFAQVLLLAHALGALTLREVSVDGSKVHADAAKSHAVSYGRLLELEQVLRAEVAELLQWGEPADQGALPAEVDLAMEIALREERLRNLERAKDVLEARAQERYAAELAAHEAQMRAGEEQADETGRKPGGPATAYRQRPAPSRPVQLH